MELPLYCLGLVEGANPGGRIGLIKRGQRGYYELDVDPGGDLSLRNVEKLIDEMNAKGGITREQRLAMQWGSAFGFETSGATPEAWLDAEMVNA